MVGVPVGVQIAWLSNSSSGKPLDVTRTDPMRNCAVTQGPLAAGGGGRAQPATTYGAESVMVGMPDTSHLRVHRGRLGLASVRAHDVSSLMKYEILAYLRPAK